MGIEIVIGPIFYESLEKLNEIKSITFISLTNKTEKIPDNAIAFGIDIDSQIDALKKYFDKIDVSKTLLLFPNSEFFYESKTVEKNDILKFYRTYPYDINPKKITGQIEKITNYRERKKDLERRIKILKKSDLYKDKNELKKLEQMHTLGKVNFDSVVIIDFGERLKSVLTSFMFSDVSNKKVKFFTVNQWFDKTFFNENAMENLHFPSVDYNNLKKLEQMHTLGKVNFDSVVIIDFGERLKSVLTSFNFADVSNEKIKFFTINQWFDKTFFSENAMENLHFPSINFKNLKKFRKKFLKIYNEEPNEVSILAYDALGLIYYCWVNNNGEFKSSQLYNKDGFKGLHGEFHIEGNSSKQKLKIYKIVKKKFVNIY